MLRREEEAFNKTLDRGNRVFVLMHSEVDIVTPHDGDRGSGSTRARRDRPAELRAFKLYDTYGFPLDLTELMARERDSTVDVAGFEKLMDEQRARARAAQKKEVIDLSDENCRSRRRSFLVTISSKPEAVVEAVAAGQERRRVNVVLDRTACYAEMGGQVGDHGVLHVPGMTGPKSGNSCSTPRSAAMFSSIARSSSRAARPRPAKPSAFQSMRPTPRAFSGHHTVTHLLHWALARNSVARSGAERELCRPGQADVRFFERGTDAAAEARSGKTREREDQQRTRRFRGREIPYVEAKKRSDIQQFFGDKYGETSCAWCRSAAIRSG